MEKRNPLNPAPPANGQRPLFSGATALGNMLFLAGVVALVAAGWYARRRLARRPVSAAAAPVAAVPQSPADIARAALNRIEAEGWAERGDVARHYEAVAVVVREYLGSIDPKVHAAQTSSELLRVLATRRSNGTWHGTARVLGDADLVKFAGVLPDEKTARAFVTGARSVIDAWGGPEAHS